MGSWINSRWVSAEASHPVQSNHPYNWATGTDPVGRILRPELRSHCDPLPHWWITQTSIKRHADLEGSFIAYYPIYCASWSRPLTPLQRAIAIQLVFKVPQGSCCIRVKFGAPEG